MFLFLFMLWLMLNAHITAEIIIIGLIAAGGVRLFLCRFMDRPLRGGLAVIIRIPQIVLYFGLLIKEIAAANIFVAKVIYAGTPRPVIRTFKTRLRTGLARSVLANSITITPGTVTLECEGDTLTVHCLMPELARSLENSPLERRLLKIEEGI